MSLNHIINTSSANKIEIRVERVISDQVITEQIVPPVGGETCSGNTCVNGDLKVECVDATKLNYKTPDFGTVGQFLTSTGAGGVEFTTQTPPDLTPIEDKIQNITATAGVTDIVGTTNTEDLTVQADDSSTILFKPADRGVAGQVLKTDGIGGVYFGADEFNPSGLEYTGTGLTAQNKIVKFNSNDGLSAVEATFEDTALGPQFNELNLNNVGNLQTKTITKLPGDTTPLTVTSDTYGVELEGGDGTLTVSPAENVLDHATGATTVSGKTFVNVNVDGSEKAIFAPVITSFSNDSMQLVGQTSFVLGSSDKIFLERNAGAPINIAEEIDMNTHKITGLVDGSDPQDAVTVSQLGTVSGDVDGRLDTLEQKTSTLNVSEFGGTQVIDNSQITHRIGLVNKLTHTATDTNIQNSNCSMNAVSGNATITATDTVQLQQGGLGVITGTAVSTTVNHPSVVTINTIGIPKLTVTGSSTKINGNKISIDDQKGDDVAVSYLGGVSSSINGNSGIIATGDYDISGGANTLELTAGTQTALLQGGNTVQLRQGTDNMVTGTAVNTTVNHPTTVNLSAAGVPKLTVTGTETTSTLPILMSGQRIQNLGNATGAGTDAMNRTSVETITNALDGRLTTEEGKIVALEDTTSCLSRTGAGPTEEFKADCTNIVLDTDHFIVQDTGGTGPLAKLTINDPSGPTPHTTIIQNTELEIDADRIVIRDTGDNPVNKIVIDGTTTALTDDIITATATSGINLTAPTITANGVLDAGINKITSTYVAQNDEDVINKKYFDDNSGGGGSSEYGQLYDTFVGADSIMSVNTTKKIISNANGTNMNLSSLSSTNIVPSASNALSMTINSVGIYQVCFKFFCSTPGSTQKTFLDVVVNNNPQSLRTFVRYGQNNANFTETSGLVNITTIGDVLSVKISNEGLPIENVQINNIIFSIHKVA